MPGGKAVPRLLDQPESLRPRALDDELEQCVQSDNARQVDGDAPSRGLPGGERGYGRRHHGKHDDRGERGEALHDRRQGVRAKALDEHLVGHGVKAHELTLGDLAKKDEKHECGHQRDDRAQVVSGKGQGAASNVASALGEV